MVSVLPPKAAKARRAFEAEGLKEAEAAWCEAPGLGPEGA